MRRRREGKGERILVRDEDAKRRALEPGRKGLPGKCGLRVVGEGEGRGREASALELGGRETDLRGRLVEGGSAQRFAEASCGSFSWKATVLALEREKEMENRGLDGAGGRKSREDWRGRGRGRRGRWSRPESFNRKLRAEASRGREVVVAEERAA